MLLKYHTAMSPDGVPDWGTLSGLPVPSSLGSLLVSVTVTVLPGTSDCPFCTLSMRT
nr:hypothetical protein [Alicyclobacillus acidocaldarius]